MRYKIFPIEADSTTESAHHSNDYKRTVILSNIDIAPELVEIRSKQLILLKSHILCMAEDHKMFNLDLLHTPVMELRGEDNNIFYREDYSEMLTNMIKREFPQVYLAYGGKADEI